MREPSRPPRTSLVVMTRNRPAALADCLASLVALAPESEPFEVIVVDDGSEPPARDTAQAFADRLDLRCERLEHRGVAAARNCGLAAARGERVGFLADDFRLPADYLLQVDRFFRARPDAAVVSFDLRSTGPSRLRAVQDLYMRLSLAQHHDLRPDADGVVTSFTLPASRAAVFRREVFERVGNFDESLRVGEDGDLGRRLAAQGIPVHQLFRRFIEHHEPLSAAGYLRQRIRYGHSFVRVLGGGAARATLSRAGLAGVPLCAARKLAEWRPVAQTLGEGRRFVALAPLLFVFLGFFYYGALRELRAPGSG